MRTKTMGILGAIAAVALTFGAVSPAFAAGGTAQTGAKSCPASSYAFTRGVNPAGGTMKHYQSINGIIWASPTHSNAGPGNVTTVFYYSQTNRSFQNSYITYSKGISGAGAFCA